MRFVFPTRFEQEWSKEKRVQMVQCPFIAVCDKIFAGTTTVQTGLSLTLGPRGFRSETFIDGRQSPGGFSIRDPARGGGPTPRDKNDPAETLEENASLPF